MSVNTKAIYDLAAKATLYELSELIDSEYDNLMYLGSMIEEYEGDHCGYDILLTQIKNTKQTLNIYKEVLNQRVKIDYHTSNLKILNNSSIPIVPLE